MWKLSQFAVPIFMMVAGYFAYGRDENTIRRRLAKIIKILILALTLYTVYNSLLHLKNEDFVNWIIGILSIKVLIRFWVFCTVDYAIFLWYLIAMVEIYILWLSIYKHDKVQGLLVRTMPLMFYGRIIIAVVTSYYNAPWYLHTNFITCGLCWFLFGFYVKGNEEHLEKSTNMKLALLIIIGAWISVIPVIFNIKINFSSIGTILMSCSLFCLAIKNKYLSINRGLEFIGDKLSLYIYVLHMLIGDCFLIIMNKLGNAGVALDWMHPILTVISSILFALVIYNARTQNKAVNQ